MRTCEPLTSTSQPSPRSTSAISGTSRISGQLVSVVVPSASNAAAISFNTLVFAPTTCTSPVSRPPPQILKCSLTGVHASGCRTRGRARRSLQPMAVHPTRIYTRTGDDGTTGLGDFSRVHKTDPRLVTYADVEETNAAIGVAVALGNLTDELAGVLRLVQNDLFDVGADLCTPIVPEPKYPPLRV